MKEVILVPRATRFSYNVTNFFDQEKRGILEREWTLAVPPVGQWSGMRNMHCLLPVASFSRCVFVIKILRIVFTFNSLVYYVGHSRKRRC